MELVHDYRERAACFEQRAAHARDPDTKRRFLEIAAAWRTMANQVERVGRRFLFDAKADSRLFIDFEDPFIPLDHQRNDASQPSVDRQGDPGCAPPEGKLAILHACGARIARRSLGLAVTVPERNNGCADLDEESRARRASRSVGKSL
jgi:hypothetical protein